MVLGIACKELKMFGTLGTLGTLGKVAKNAKSAKKNTGILWHPYLPAGGLKGLRGMTSPKGNAAGGGDARRRHGRIKRGDVRFLANNSIRPSLVKGFTRKC